MRERDICAVTGLRNLFSTFFFLSGKKCVCACVCVCVREREREVLFLS